MKHTIEDWEKVYINALMKALQPKGNVLEVGFGYTAELVQSYHPSSHTIIESDEKAAIDANIWAEKQKNVTIIEDSWEKALPELDIFDAIFFSGNKYDEKEIEQIESKSQSLQTKHEVLLSVEKKYPQIKTMSYSDQDLEEFCAKMGKKKELTRFLQELMNHGQISEEQYETMFQKYDLEKQETAFDFQKLPDPSFLFFQECEKHMQKGSRFSCFLNDPTSKYENPEFFEHVITNPNLDYKEKMIPISPNEHYPFHTALIMVIEKINI